MATRGECKQEQARIGGFQNGKRKGREAAVMECTGGEQERRCQQGERASDTATMMRP